MKEILVAGTLTLLTALQLPAASEQRGKERLRELAVAPKMELGFNFVFNWNSSLANLSEEASLSERIAKLSASLQQHPDDGQKRIQLSRLFAENSDTNAAKASFEKAVQLCRRRSEARPRDGLALTDLGNALYGFGNREEAEGVFRKATLVSSNEWRCWVALGQFLDNQSSTRMTPSNVMYSLGTVSPKLLDYRPAPEDLERSLKLRAEASVCFDRAIDLAPNEAETFLQRAWHKCSQDFGDCLIRHYRNEAKLDVRSLTSSCFSKSAIPDLRKASELCPESYQLIGLTAWFEWWSVGTNPVNASPSKPPEFASFPEKSKQTILEAMRQLEKLGESKKTKLAAGALETLATLRFLTDVRKDAMTAELRQAVTLDPAREKSWDLLLGSLVMQDAPPEALLTVCEERLKQKDSVWNRLLLAKALYKQNKFEKAEDEARAALRLDTNNVPSHLMLAATLIRQNKDAEFTRNLLTHVQTLIEKLPKDEEKTDRAREYALNLAIFLALDGDTALAKTWIELVLEKFPDDEQAKEILKAIP